MSRIAALLLCVCVLLPATVWAGPEEEEKLAQAVAVLDKLMLVPEQSIPEALLRDAHAVAVVPNVFKAALVFGGRRGTGVISVRRADGTWSHPSFMALTGGSFGFQAGLQSSDVILVFRTQRGVDNIIRGKFTLGADASVAAGPVGRNAQASTDEQLKAEIFAWSRARGLFAGVALDGAVLNIDHDANAAVYGPETTPRAIFEGRVERGSEQVVDFRDRLEEYSSR
ncbi:MAG: lipid-binding SYLF domain-containing protein [Xanthomonadaceae bacterium]|nr:lipid-binding SYLF domain-containing protein [Xanthomonadaceae bacterium]